MATHLKNNHAINSAEFDRIDGLQRNLKLVEASELLDSHVEKAIRLNDSWFLNIYYQFKLYTLLPDISGPLLAVLQQAINHAKDKDFLITSLNLYANLQNAIGNVEDVLGSTEQLLQLAPERFDVPYLHLLNGGNIDNIALYKKLWRKRSGNNRYISLGFSLYEILEKQGDKSTEKTLMEANTYTNKLLRDIPKPGFSRIIAEAGITSHSQRTYKPVFIMGLPRSGTTLLEQHLTRFPDTRSLGECNFLKISASYANSAVFYDSEYDLDKLQCDKLRHAYFNQLSSRRYNETIVVDKSLSNLYQLPILEKIFPDFTAIICYRDPVKNALSIFRKKFEGDYRYAYNIEKLCDHIKKTRRLVEGYQDQFKDRSNIHFLNFDNYVLDPSNADQFAHTILGQHITTGSTTGHVTPDNLILTASARQARKPMNPKQMHDDHLLSGIIKSLDTCLKTRTA